MKRRSRPGTAVGLLLGLGMLAAAAPAPAQTRETVGLITELKVGRGRIEVKPAGAADWRRAGPLLALRAGDALRATDDALAVVVLTGSRGTVKVEARNSPLVLGEAPAGDSKVQKALAFLSTSTREAPKAVLATRAGARPPLILSPRNSPVMPESLTFEWLGSQFARYTVRVAGPSGVLLERKGVSGARLDYPGDGPPLSAGVRYTLQVVSASHPPQEAQFEIVDARRAEGVRQTLKAIEESLGAGVPPNTLVALKVGALASEGLLHDARRTVVAALARDPDEPTLHQLLANLYLQAGLADLAAESQDEAQFLLTGGK